MNSEKNYKAITEQAAIYLCVRAFAYRQMLFLFGEDRRNETIQTPRNSSFTAAVIVP